MRILHVHPGDRTGAELIAYLQDNDSELEMTRWKQRPAMLVLPGGAYAFLSEREGEPVALKYSAQGYQAFVLRYTLHSNGEEAMLDAAAAVRMIREHAQDWHVNPHQIAVSGFSAGGNLALWLAAAHSASMEDPSRPDALVLGYPAVTGKGCEYPGYDFLGDAPANQQLLHFPPCFVWTTQQDELVDCMESVKLWSLLQQNHIPSELHVFEHGLHGLATADAATGRPDEKAVHWLPMSLLWLERHFFE